MRRQHLRAVAGLIITLCSCGVQSATNRQSVVAFARINGYLLEITGTDKSIETLAGSLIVSPLPPN